MPIPSDLHVLSTYLHCNTEIIDLNCGLFKTKTVSMVSVRSWSPGCGHPQEMGKTVECLGDLQGPKFRVGELAGCDGSRGAHGCGSQSAKPVGSLFGMLLGTLKQVVEAMVALSCEP